MNIARGVIILGIHFLAKLIWYSGCKT